MADGYHHCPAGIWSPAQKYLFTGTLISENGRKGVDVPTVACFSAQRDFHWRRLAPYVPYFALELLAIQFSWRR